MKQQLEPINFAATDTQRITRINSSMLLRTITLEITLSITWAGAVTLFTDALARCLRIQVFLDGTGAAYDFDGDVLKNYLTLVNEVATDYTEIGAGAGLQTGTWRVELPFADPRMTDPDDTSYDLALAPQSYIQVNFAGLAALTATAGAHALTALQVLGTLDGVQRPTGMPAIQTRPIRRFKQYAIGDASLFPAGGIDKPFRLDVGQLIRRMVVQTREASSATRAYLDTLVTGTQWDVNSLKYGLSSWQCARILTRQQQQVAPPTGVIMEDFDNSGQLNFGTLFSLAGADQASYDLTMAAALANGVEIKVLEERILPVPG